MQNDKWLSELKVGDEVVAHYHSGRGAGTNNKETIQKVSSAWIWTDRNKYHRRDGMRVGIKEPARSHIAEPWGEYASRERKRVLAYQVKDRIAKATLDQLERIAAILDEKPEVGDGN